jgi:hypothetical protein
MIPHVAQAGEARGRVVLRLCSSNPNAVALEAAIRVAQAFQSEIESLFVEDLQLIELTGFSFAREISLTGRQSRAISAADIEREFRLAYAPLRRRIEALARAADVPVHQRVVRDEPVHALAAACAECGPWNVVALAEPFGSATSESLRRLFDMVADATGVILVGPRARRTAGPVIIAIEEVDRLPALVRTAERLARVTNGEIVILLIAEDEERLHWMESQARLVLGDRSDARIVPAELARGAPAVVAEALRRLDGGFVIAQFGGLAVPSEGDLRPLAAALLCPLFLVR